MAEGLEIKDLRLGAPPDPPLRVVFMGTPDFAAVSLRALLGWPGAKVLAAYTQPDRPCGRGRECKPSPVKVAALEAGIEVRQPLNFKDPADVDALRALEADVLVVAAYGLILPQGVLDACRLMPINVHASLLPRWRGAAPIQRAIEAGDSATGITIMRMVLGLDAGPILLQRALRIADTDHAGTLHDELAEMGADALLEALTRLPQGRLLNMAQDESRVTYAPKLLKDEGRIDWNAEAQTLHNRIRAMHPWPGAYFDWTPTYRNSSLVLTIEPGRVGEELPPGTAPGTILGVVEAEGGKYLAIACADKAYLTPRVTPQGKKPQDAAAFACGYLKNTSQA
ncbi:MAG: methionyl-tRNA formyltransferase [Humidesulfovibrio sp.]|uniref:methionyl-tRNA formyltransferase n=1 Tax=Humidesulfovibrio sp. TaxID=2910988 RepID=UPI0027EE8AE3|nr:methionyl-tRNA formyltransferase [Humidesulfovibrio sp.]MDQ7834784.1 methionyl-tRNA formyltransferase [Humidesulfovibrio sp.]